MHYLSTTLLLTALVPFAAAQVSNPLFPAHIFTIRAPEPCDQACQDIICTQPGSCTPCGSGQCTVGEECGTWAGKPDTCCIQPYNFSPSSDKLKCSDVASFLSSLDPQNPPSGSGTPKVYSAETCPSGEVIAAYAVFGEASGNLTCCERGKDAVVIESSTLSVPESVVCVNELSAGASSGNKNAGGNGSGTNGSGRVAAGVWLVAVGLAAGIYLA
ncbi:hypothetical protein TWF730_001794 [Orbilia blumenaviensis]|uniref:Uncharacterized protein n=1 Tax=Orbilia blumenaviensis TaxID=1796055 RepID=A0AAV9UEC3_9PEZI